MSLKSLFIAVASTVCLLVTASAQQQTSPPTGTDLALEVTYLKGRPPAYQVVTAKQNPGSWYALFGRVAEWQLPAGDPPVRAVRVSPFLDGDAVRITISVLRGAKFHDVEERVEAYRRRESEKVTVVALRNFGIEPFEIKVVKVPPQPSEFPGIINNTKSVEVVGIERMVSAFPSFKVTLHNLSDKNISAIKVNTLVAGKMVLTGMPQGKEGEALIQAGAFGELTQPMSTRAKATPGGYTPASTGLQQIVIDALVYEDGTYEGEAEAAAMYRGFASGRRTELKRIVPLLDSVLETAASPEELLSQLSALSSDAAEADLEELATAFPGIDRLRLKSATEAAMHGLRKALLDDLKHFQQSEAPAGAFQLWLIRVKDRHSNWLSLLSRNNSSQR